MAVVEEVRGPLWVDGQFTVRLRGPGFEPGRIVRLRRPFALIGQIPGADIRIDDPAVDGRHAFLLLDRRGIFGVDLLSRTGTRFAGAEAASSWLGTGDILEIAGRRIELLQFRIDGSPVNPRLSDDDPLEDTHGLVNLTLEPLGTPGPPWMLGSALAFVGSGEACAIRIENASASITHCALLRGTSTAHVIDLLGRRTLVNDRAVEGAAALLDGDVLTIGNARFGVRLDPPSFLESGLESESSQVLARLPDSFLLSPGQSLEPTNDPRGAMVAMLLEAVGSGRDASGYEVLDLLQQLQANTATLLQAQVDRIEAMNHEIAMLRQDAQGQLSPPPMAAEPLRLDLIPAPADTSSEPASWLLDRLNTLEPASRSTWRDLLGRLATTISHRTLPSPGQTLVLNSSETANSEIAQDRF